MDHTVLYAVHDSIPGSRCVRSRARPADTRIVPSRISLAVQHQDGMLQPSIEKNNARNAYIDSAAATKPNEGFALCRAVTAKGKEPKGVSEATEKRSWAHQMVFKCLRNALYTHIRVSLRPSSTISATIQMETCWVEFYRFNSTLPSSRDPCVSCPIERQQAYITS